MAEIASGSGQHVVAFATAFPALEWFPSDPDPIAVQSIEQRRVQADLPNLRSPRMVDVCDSWTTETWDAIVCINMIHISPWKATEALLKASRANLSAGAHLMVYGPFLFPGKPTAPSNLEFDRSLRHRNPEWGIRSAQTIAELAGRCHLVFESVFVMPANNFVLVFRKDPPP